MANICEYKMIVRGRKNACYAFFGSMAVYDDKNIERESGTDDNYELFMHGYCKWDVDSYCKSTYEGECPVSLPDDPYEAQQEGWDKYLYYTVQEHSRMFDVDVECCSADIDDPMGDIYEHFQSGNCVTVKGECPEELIVVGEMGCYCMECGMDVDPEIMMRTGGLCIDCYREDFGEEALAEAMDGYEEE